MLRFLSDLFGLTAVKTNRTDPVPVNVTESPPWRVEISDEPAFEINGHFLLHESYPILDWQAVQLWIDKLSTPELHSLAWTSVERAWLLHMRDPLGPGFQLQESDTVLLLSSLDANVARATINYMERTLGRVVKLLDGIAEIAPMGKDILLVFDDDDSYYRYVSYYYPEGGEFAFSGGMHINAGCSHYVTVKSDLRTIEPVIAHEMTHGCVGHLPLPAWLNEGLAVNVEQRLTGVRSAYTPQQLRSKHLSFWDAEVIQQFWSGVSFLRTDDGNLLSYDLARLLVKHMSKDWEMFKPFVLSANEIDAGVSAARQCLGIELSELVCALLDQKASAAWGPTSAS